MRLLTRPADRESTAPAAARAGAAGQVEGDHLTPAISRWLRGHRFVADIGAGTGARATALAAEGHTVVAIDVNEGRVAALATLNESVRPLVADAKRIPLASDSVDGVLCLETLEHVGDWRSAIAELARITRKAGVLVLSVPTADSERLFRRLHRRWVEMSGHEDIVSERELEETLAGRGWAVTSKLRVNGVYTLMWLILAPLQTPFDDTGTPLRHRALQRLYWGGWRLLFVVRLRSALEALVDRYLAKSILLVCRRM
jgi:SAM-dependent methyltransferase